jgi:hypothetical protein
MMEAVSTSETSVNFYQAVLHNPKDSHLKPLQGSRIQASGVENLQITTGFLTGT